MIKLPARKSILLAFQVPPHIIPIGAFYSMLTPPPLRWYSLPRPGAATGRNLPIYPPNAFLFYRNAWDHDLMPNYIQGWDTKLRDDARQRAEPRVLT